jgi:hypothetical protein
VSRQERALDLRGNEIKHARFQGLDVFPVGPVIGELVMLTSETPPVLCIWNGIVWQRIITPVVNLSYTHTQTEPQSVWTITHGLGYDPGGVVVTSDDGYVMDGGGVQYLVSGYSLHISFDIAFAGSAVLS